MRVIKTRENTYHTDENCSGLKRAKQCNWIDEQTAEAWNLEPCQKCVGEPDKDNSSKWSEFVREKKQS